MLRHLAAILGGAVLACAAHAGPLWFADHDGIHRIETDTNQVTANVARRDVQALALDRKDGSVWALTTHTLFKYDANGATLLRIDLRSLAHDFDGGSRLALDPSDDSIWLADADAAFHLDSAGNAIARADSRDGILDIALAQDESLWILGRSTLSRHSPQGVRLGKDNLDWRAQQAQFLAIDDANGALWLAGQKRVFRAPLALPLDTSVTRTTDEVVSGIALDTGTGTLWVAGQSSLFAFGKDGAPLAEVDLSRRHLDNFQALDFDAQSQALWLGHERGLSRFDIAGRIVVTLPASVKVNAISEAPSGIVPIVTLVSPPTDALTRDAFVPIRVHYDASCFGQPCNFPPSTFAAYVLTATLNGQDIGGAFQFDPATGDAAYVPTMRYAEGANSFTAYVTDGSGRPSQPISSTFTVDTVAPQFLGVTPASGSTFTSPNITLQGSVDDILARVLLESFSGATFSGPNPAGQAFSYAITLQPGTNVFRLTATDPAGNATPLSLSYVFGTLTLAVASPADGATIDDDKVTVTGTFSGSTSATITVNGIAAAVSGNTFTTADVPLHFGANTLTVSGSTPQGATATRTLTVTSTFPAITLDSPTNGATVDGASVLVTGHIQAPANSGVAVNGVAGIVGAGGTFYANAVPLQPGANTITASVTTQSGKSASAQATVSSSGPLPVVITGTPLQGPAPLTVGFRYQNLAGVPLSSLSFDPGGPGGVATSGPDDLIAYTYTQPGTFTANVTLFDTAGNPYPQQIVVQALDPAQMDQLFAALWNGMNAALVAGDKAKAMTFLSAAAQEKYGPVFDKIMPQMASLVASYSPLQRSSLSPGIGEYAINRTIDGVNRIFFIYFIQDTSGAWVIDAM